MVISSRVRAQSIFENSFTILPDTDVPLLHPGDHLVQVLLKVLVKTAEPSSESLPLPIGL